MILNHLIEYVQAMLVKTHNIGEDQQRLNYYQYFDWVTTMKLNHNYKPSPADVLAMAQKCPLKAGRVVYAARALYNNLTHSQMVFANNCDGSFNRKANTKNNGIIAANNEVIVYPNPSSGLINIQLNKTNAQEATNWQVSITDTYGKNILVQSLKGIQTQLNITATKGIYFARVYNKLTGKSFVNKIIIQ